MPDTPELLIDAFVSNSTPGARAPKVVMLSDGSMLVAYATEEGGAPGFDIRGQLFDASGVPIGDEVQFDFNQRLNERTFDIVAAEGNRVAIVVEIEGDNNRDLETAVFRVDETGVTDLDLRFESAASDGRFELLNPTIADVGNGDDFRIFFTQRIGVDESVFGQGMNNGQEFQLPLDRDYRGNANAELVSDTLENGNIVVVLDRDGPEGRDELRPLVMIMTPGGQILRQGNIGNRDIQAIDPEITALVGGGYVVAYAQDRQQTKLFYQVFDANGTGVGGLRQFGVGDAGQTNNNEPTIAPLEDGGFIIFYDRDGGASQIRGQRFDAQGNRVGEDFLVFDGSGAEPDATLLADGRVAVSFFVPAEGVVKTAILDTAEDPITITGTGRADELIGTDAVEIILGLGGADTIFGLGGDDTIDGGDAGDTIDGGNGNDQIFGDGGRDTIDGGNGDDSIDGGIGNDSLVGGAGRDTIDGGGGADTIDGGTGADTLLGGSGNDNLLGGDGDDEINGGHGRDVITGGLGSDLLTGGGQSDIFVFATGDPQDVITDFNARDNNEKIDFSHFQDFNAFADLDGRLSQVGEDVQIRNNSDTLIITLQNVALADLDANDFLF